ncbi:MAG: DUF4199 domain-containing protein [Saprospiraceae bacterium]|nr:DUF4199 domain-containing protein [Saprospiraceae bacterium]
MAQTTKMQTALKWGGIMGLALTIVSLLLYLSGIVEAGTNKGSTLSTILSYIISIGSIFLGIQAYRKGNNDNLTIGDGVVLGMLIGIVGGVVIALYNALYLTVLDSSALEMIKEQAMASVGEMDPDQEEQAQSWINAFTSLPAICMMLVIMKFFLGLVIGLISGLILQNEGNEYPDLTV